MQEKIIEELRQELKEQIKENQELLKINEEHQKINGELRKEIDGLVTVIDLIRKYIKENTRWFDSEYAKVYGELCDCKGANSNRLEVLTNPSKILEILERVNEE